MRYDWGDRHAERIVLGRHAGEFTGTVTFLGFARPMEKLRLDGGNLHFEVRSQESMNGETREAVRAYAAELRGQAPDEVLAFRMQTRGGFGSHAPIEFAARRVDASVAAGAASEASAAGATAGD